MTICRFTGDAVTHRFGSRQVLRIGGALACAGVSRRRAPALDLRRARRIRRRRDRRGEHRPGPLQWRGPRAGRAAGHRARHGDDDCLHGTAGRTGLIGFVADATSLPVAFVLVAAMFGAVAAAAGRVVPDRLDANIRQRFGRLKAEATRLRAALRRGRLGGLYLPPLGGRPEQ